MQIDPERKEEKGIEDNIRSHKLNPYYREASYVTFPATLSNHQVCSQSKGEKKRTVKPFSRHYTEQNSTHSSKDSWLTAAASLPPHSNVSIDAAAAAAPAVVVDEEERVAERAPVKLSSRIPWPSHRDEDVRGRRGRKTTLEPASQPANHCYVGNRASLGRTFLSISACSLNRVAFVFYQPFHPRLHRLFFLEEEEEQVSFMINPTRATAQQLLDSITKRWRTYERRARIQVPLHLFVPSFLALLLWSLHSFKLIAGPPETRDKIITTPAKNVAQNKQLDISMNVNLCVTR